MERAEPPKIVIKAPSLAIKACPFVLNLRE
jgi:hypothetical protein